MVNLGFISHFGISFINLTNIGLSSESPTDWYSLFILLSISSASFRLVNLNLVVNTGKDISSPPSTVLIANYSAVALFHHLLIVDGHFALVIEGHKVIQVIVGHLR